MACKKDKSVGGECEDRESYERQQDRIITDINKFLPRKSETPRDKNRLVREKAWELHALRDYFREYNASERSSNVDATNRTLSVLDESEAYEVLTFLT